MYRDTGASGRPTRIELRSRFAGCRGCRTRGGEQAAVGDRVVADAGQERRVGNAVPGRGFCRPYPKRRVEDLPGEFGRVELAAARESAGLCIAAGKEQCVLACIFAREGDVAATFGKILAGGDAAEIRSAIATRRNAALSAKADTIEIIVEDEVDDAGDGIGAVHGRIAAGHDIDPLDEIGGDGVHVDPFDARRRRDLTTTVYQCQRAGRAETAKVKRIDAGRADETGRVRLTEGGAQLRQLVQRITEREIARRQIFGRDADDRNG